MMVASAYELGYRIGWLLGVALLIGCLVVAIRFCIKHLKLFIWLKKGAKMPNEKTVDETGQDK